MCNAHNHPPGCRCGWGGDGHLGRSSGPFGGYDLRTAAGRARVYEAGDLVGSLTAIRAYLTREHALLRFARLTEVGDEARAAAQLAQLLSSGDALVERVARDVRQRHPALGGAPLVAEDWALRISQLTRMTLAETGQSLGRFGASIFSRWLL